MVTAVSGGIGMAVFKHLIPNAKGIVTSNRSPVESFWTGPWPVNSIHVSSDLTEEDEVKELIDQTISRFGHLDVMINCIGGSLYSHPIETFPVAEFDEVLSVNLRSAFLLTKHAIRAMKSMDGMGKNIVHIVSSAAKHLSPRKAPYGIAKAGVARLIQYAAAEVADLGIVVNGISPTYVFTARHEREIEDKIKQSGKTRDEIVNNVLENQLIKEKMVPENLIEAIMLLATTRVITGQIFNVDMGENITY